MLSANIYNCGVSPAMVEAGIEGVEMVTGPADISVVESGYRFLRPDDDGFVDYYKIATPALDPHTDIHLFMSGRPFASDNVGYAEYLSGVALTVCSDGDELEALTTSAHETSHGTGFHLDGVDDTGDEGELSHCDNDRCILSSGLADKQFCFCANCRDDIDQFLGINMDLLRGHRRSSGFVVLEGPEEHIVRDACNRIKQSMGAYL